MVRAIYYGYIDSFKGLRKEVWWMALVTLINRSGTMVFPFLSLYMTKNLNFTLKEVGIVMVAFGMGSVIGGWLGGKLSDKWGYYPVMLWSLIVSGILFLGIQFLQSFYSLCIGIFVLMVVADTFRPAAYVAVGVYSKPENRTRSVTLFRLAINLGFAIGPALGGIIIGLVGYNGLFWADGLTCILAGIAFAILLDKRQAMDNHNSLKQEKRSSPYKDIPYLLFLFSMLLIACGFMQLFSTLPLFFNQEYQLSEVFIGCLMAANGFLIFAFEMPLVKYFDKPRYSIYKILLYSTLLFSLGYLVLNISSWKGIAIISILLLTMGEMLCFPFLNKFALDRSQKGKSGEYLALFSISFSFSHIIAHPFGMKSIDLLGYKPTWDIILFNTGKRNPKKVLKKYKSMHLF